MAQQKIQGLYTALVTPFRDGKIDEAAFEALVEWQITEGVHGVVPVGTTGESPTLSPEEHKRVVELCVRAAGGRVPVMAGAGSNATEEAIAFTRHAQTAGASSVLSAAPYYNKPTREGLFRHFEAIHDASDIPIVIYNIPGRSVVNIDDDTLARLAELPRIAGLKDATGDLARVSTLRHRVGDRLALLSGEDMTAVGFNAMGGQGCISVTANVAPHACADVQNACLRGNYAEALKLHESLVALHQAMFCETNPIPVKFAVSLLGRCAPDIRLPLTQATEPTQASLKKAMQRLGML